MVCVLETAACLQSRFICLHASWRYSHAPALLFHAAAHVQTLGMMRTCAESSSGVLAQHISILHMPSTVRLARDSLPT
jgi:hypothetical protein